jgi:hypothetical protein
MKFRFAIGVGIVAALALQAGAADDLRTAEMADHARQWSQKGRDDLAAETWRKLLIVVPDHPEALVSLGLIEARAGRMREAQALLARARRVPASPARLKVLAAAIDDSHPAAQGPPVPAAPVEAPKPPAPPAARPAPAPTPPQAFAPPKVVQQGPAPSPPQASEPARRGSAAPPAPLPRRASPDSNARSSAAAAWLEPKPPSPVKSRAEPATAALPSAAPGPAVAEAGPALQLSRESTPRPAAARGDTAHDALGELRSAAATSTEGWPQTRLRLEQLARSNPGDLHYRLALAVHLSLREPTRREALRQFQALGQQEPGNQEIPTAWRRALLALSPREGDEVLFTAYLAQQPNDAAVMERLNTLRWSTGAASWR